MPQYRKTDSFKSDYKKFFKDNQDLEKAAKKAFGLFQQDPGHPSLLANQQAARVPLTCVMLLIRWELSDCGDRQP
jgi:hypothetical protein